MKKSRLTETQIVKILKEVESGRLVKEVCRERGVGDSTYLIVLILSGMSLQSGRGMGELLK